MLCEEEEEEEALLFVAVGLRYPVLSALGGVAMSLSCHAMIGASNTPKRSDADRSTSPTLVSAAMALQHQVFVYSSYRHGTMHEWCKGCQQDTNWRLFFRGIRKRSEEKIAVSLAFDKSSSV